MRIPWTDLGRWLLVAAVGGLLTATLGFLPGVWAAVQCAKGTGADCWRCVWDAPFYTSGALYFSGGVMAVNGLGILLVNRPRHLWSLQICLYAVLPVLLVVMILPLLELDGSGRGIEFRRLVTIAAVGYSCICFWHRAMNSHAKEDA